MNRKDSGQVLHRRSPQRKESQPLKSWVPSSSNNMSNRLGPPVITSASNHPMIFAWASIEALRNQYLNAFISYNRFVTRHQDSCVTGAPLFLPFLPLSVLWQWMWFAGSHDTALDHSTLPIEIECKDHNMTMEHQALAAYICCLVCYSSLSSESQASR